MIFETAKVQQNEADQEMIGSLTSRIDEQNNKAVQMPREAVEQDETVTKLKAKLGKCKRLTERLELAQRWRSRQKEVLQEAGEKLENFVGIAINVTCDVAVLMDEQDRLSLKSESLCRFLQEEKKKMELILDAARVYKSKYERRGQIAKHQLVSNDCGDFMAKFSGEMINNDILLEVEAHRLATVELGYDIEKLASLAKSNRNDAFKNLIEIFSSDSKTLNDAAWVVEKQEQWAQKVSPELEA